LLGRLSRRCGYALWLAWRQGAPCRRMRAAMLGGIGFVVSFVGLAPTPTAGRSLRGIPYRPVNPRRMLSIRNSQGRRLPVGTFVKKKM
jgi:hypothetical protein